MVAIERKIFRDLANKLVEPNYWLFIFCSLCQCRTTQKINWKLLVAIERKIFREGVSGEFYCFGQSSLRSRSQQISNNFNEQLLSSGLSPAGRGQAEEKRTILLHTILLIYLLFTLQPVPSINELHQIVGVLAKNFSLDRDQLILFLLGWWRTQNKTEDKINCLVAIERKIFRECAMTTSVLWLPPLCDT